MLLIYVRLIDYAGGEFLSAHETREGALMAWSIETNTPVSEFTEKNDRDDPDRTHIHRHNRKLGIIAKTTLRP